MKKISSFIIVALLVFICASSFSIAPKNSPVAPKQTSDSIKNQDTRMKLNDTAGKVQNSLPIDTAQDKKTSPVTIPVDTVKKIDSSLVSPISENTLTNTKLFIYIILTVLGLGLFFYIFVITLFKTFHKKKSTRQSLLLSWNLFFIVSIIWIFIIWGMVAGFWSAASFMIVVIFLFIISLIMTIIAVKSK